MTVLTTVVVFVGLAVSTLLPTVAQAQSVEGQSISIDGEGEEYIREIVYNLEQPFGGKSSIRNLGEYIQTIYQFALGIVGIIAVVLIMAGGIRWIAAAGNESAIGEAKEMIVSAVTGLAIALLSYIILLTISPQLVVLDVAIKKIPIPTESSEMYQCPSDSTLTEKTGGHYCKGMGSGVVSSTDINTWIMKHNTGNVSPTFLKAIMKTESGFCVDNMSDIKDKDTGAISHACGLMQVLPTTAKTYASTCTLPECASVTSNLDSDPQAMACCNAIRTNPEKAICAGVSFMNSLKGNSFTGGDEALMAAAYNGGTCNPTGTNGALCDSAACPGQLMYQCPANKGYTETRNYVKKVSANKERICADNSVAAACTTTASGTANNAYCKANGEAVYSLAPCTAGVAKCITSVGSSFSWLTVPQVCPAGQHVAFTNGQQTVSGYNNFYTTQPNCAP